MSRALIAALLLANLVFFGWTQGWLDAYTTVRSTGDREPDRLRRQVRPESIRVLPASAAVAAVAPDAFACWEAGPFNDAELASAQAAAQSALPADSWVTVRADQPGTWIVYMGRFADRESLTRKEDELRRRGAPYSLVTEPPALTPGLSLGRFDQRSAASTALEQLVQQGVRTARVVELAPPSTRHLLRVVQADEALSVRLAALQIEVLSRNFTACPAAVGG